MANIFTVYSDKDGTNFYNLYNSVNIDGDIDPTLYTEHVWTGSNDWYGLALTYYNDIRLWWIILVTNKIVNPFTNIVPGTRLKILKGAVVSQILSQI